MLFQCFQAKFRLSLADTVKELTFFQHIDDDLEDI